MRSFFVGILILVVGCISQKTDIPEHIKDTTNLKVFSSDTELRGEISLIHQAAYKAPKQYMLEWYDESIDFYDWLAGVEIDSNGRLYIADARAKKVHVFQSDGSYIKSMGGEGRGPGEFVGITETEIVDDHLLVYDFMGSRASYFSQDSLAVVSSETILPAVNQDEIEAIDTWLRQVMIPRSDGTYLAMFLEQIRDARVNSSSYNLDKDRPAKYYIMNEDSKIISEEVLETHKKYEILTTKVEGEHESSFRSLPFLGRSMIRISDSNHIYSTWTDDFLIKVYGPDGNYKRGIYYPMSRKNIRRKEILSMVGKDDYNREVIEHAELPLKWPVIRSMVVDDKDRLWVSTIIEEEGARQWWVLENTGELVTKFKWPDNRSIEAVKDGHAYVLETHMQTGQQTVVKYEIEIDR